jgi:hypothetical protein
MSEVIDGLGPNGKLMVVGAAMEPIEVTPVQLITGSRTIQGWASGTPADAEDTLRFSELTGVRPMIETYPLEKAARGLRANDERQCTVPRGSDDVKWTSHRCQVVRIRARRTRVLPFCRDCRCAVTLYDKLAELPWHCNPTRR